MTESYINFTNGIAISLLDYSSAPQALDLRKRDLRNEALRRILV